ncbi:hypothetical protein CCR75_004415 [Bremia lactucae]|uniref:FYVE-type domain-containing protein n=1 Tax=Bremia lactucae TaxID=4779 RepID=A0A976FSX7_BRELC|nr:hypothetical protein CCR75_004415 [Bremia lactucae]
MEGRRTVSTNSENVWLKGKRQELWSTLHQRLIATPLFNGKVRKEKDSDNDEHQDVVPDNDMNNNRLKHRVRCRSNYDARGRCRNLDLENTTFLSPAQKAGCYGYIKRRYTIALAFASNDATDDIREPSNISPAEESDVIGSNWEFTKLKNGVHLFKSKRSQCEVRGSTRVNASVKNVMSILSTGASTQAFADAQKIIFGADQVIEAKVLASCADSTTSRYFHCGLKYQAMKNPFGTAPLDLVFLDYTDVKTTSEGKLLGFRILESIRIPALQPAFKYLRASIRCEVYTVVETDTPGVVDVTFASHLDPKSKCASIKRSQWLDLACARLGNIRSYAEKTSIGGHLSLDSKPLSHGESESLHAHCNVCQHGFSFFRKRYTCQRCNEWTCGRCCRKMPVLIDSLSKCVTVCLSCILHSRNHPDEIRRGELGISTRRRDIINKTFIIYDE